MDVQFSGLEFGLNIVRALANPWLLMLPVGLGAFCAGFGLGRYFSQF
jgi:hypothetical protein